MFVGEIGIPRREYLYDLTYTDMTLIRRGYVRRFHPQWEMARLIAHQTHYCMGVAPGESAKTTTEWLTFPWERNEDGEPTDQPSLSEVEKLRRLMAEENARAEAAER